MTISLQSCERALAFGKSLFFFNGLHHRLHAAEPHHLARHPALHRRATRLHAGDAQVPAAATRYILFNRAPGQGMDQGRPATLGRRRFDEILAEFPNRPDSSIRTGLSFIFSPFRTTPESTVEALGVFLAAAEETPRSCRSAIPGSRPVGPCRAEAPRHPNPWRTHGHGTGGSGRRYLDSLCGEAANVGLPRERLFAHGVGWAEGDPFYRVPINP